MSVGRILTQGFGTFGGRKYLPTMGLGSFAGPQTDANGVVVTGFRSRAATGEVRSRTSVAEFRSRTVIARRQSR